MCSVFCAACFVVVLIVTSRFFFFFFFNDTATTEIYTLSLHDALPIYRRRRRRFRFRRLGLLRLGPILSRLLRRRRSEEHTSELQSRLHLVCRLLLEKKKKKKNNDTNAISSDAASTSRARDLSITLHMS